MFDFSELSPLPKLSKLIDTFDWTQTSLGPKEHWPFILKSAVSLILDHSVPMVLFWGSQGIALYNDSYAALIKSRHPYLLGHPVEEVWPERRDLSKKVTHAVFQGKAIRFTLNDYDKTGPRNNLTKQYDVTYSPIRNEFDQVQGALGIIMDIALRNDAEQNFQTTVSVEQLIGGLAHNFNTLLGGITGNLELLEMRIQQGKIDILDRYIESAQDAVKRATALTHQLLAFSRRQTLTLHVTDPNHILKGLAYTFETILKEHIPKEGELRIKLGQNIWPIFCDPEQLKNALINIFTNACEALPANGGIITVESHNRVITNHTDNKTVIRPDDYVVITIHDTGAGMSAETINHAFDPFFTTKPLGKKAGLGLSMVYGFVRQSNGYVTIESKSPKGTKIHLFLPRYHRPLEVEKFLVPLPDSHTQTALIVSQDCHLRMIISENLEAMGYITTLTQTGKEALALLNGNINFNFITIDIRTFNNNPDKNFSIKIRKIYPYIPILFITGYEDQLVNFNQLLDQYSTVLQRPIVPSMILEKVKQLTSAKE